jgi:hypothetical protein
MSDLAAPRPESAKPVATWRKVLAAVLDFVSVFALGGYVIGSMTGNLTETGFKLEGAPALLLFAVIAAYFIVFSKYLGGTPWQWVLGARKRRS